MSTAADSNAAFPMHAAQTVTANRTQPFYWSVRRELWEYRSIFIAPLVVAAVILFGFVIRLARLPHLVISVEGLPWWKQYLALALPFAIAGAAILVTGVVLSIFYCLGTLNNERRDRSILFWKSLPVSDLTTVLSKASVPLVVVPIVVLVVALATQIVMLLIGGAALAARGPGPGVLWSHWPVGQMSLTLAYLVVVGTLWFAPIYGWLLAVSAWAKRMTFLWAVLTPIGLSVVERIAFDTNYVGSLIRYRLTGFVSQAFLKPPRDTHVINPVGLMTPGTYFSSPGLWFGLLVAAAFIAAAVWLRRDREPL